MAEDHSSGAQLFKVFAWVLAVLVGGIGWLAVSLGPDLWHLVVGAPLAVLAGWLVREAQAEGSELEIEATPAKVEQDSPDSEAASFNR